MGHLTEFKAKPALMYGEETLIGRLARQCAELNPDARIYINCSYQAYSVIGALSTFRDPSRLTFLWEREIMGTAWSLLNVHDHSKRDLLAIHGDLVLAPEGIFSFVSDTYSDKDFSALAVHKRISSFSRSKVDFHPRTQIVTEFTEIERRDMTIAKIANDPEIWSNSGIYLFRSQHLRGFQKSAAKSQDVPNLVVASLAEKGLLKAICFKGARHSVEKATDLPSP